MVRFGLWGWAVVLMLGAGLGACGSEGPSGEEARGAPSEAEMRAVLAEATAMDAAEAPPPVEAPLQIEADRPLPLGLWVLQAVPQVRERARREADWRLLDDAGPLEVAAALEGRGDGEGERSAALIQERYVTGLTVEGSEDRATGRVTFEAPGAYRGRFDYEAEATDEGWRMVALTWPETGVRFRPAGDGLWVPDADRLLPGYLQTTRLPPLSAAVRLPDPEDSVFVTIDGRGYLRGPEGQKLALGGLRSLLQQRAGEYRREDDGTSPLPLVIQADEGTCWRVVQWVMMVGADPAIQMYRIYFAGLQDETERLGGLSAVLPKDRGLTVTTARPAEFEKLKFKFFADEGTGAPPSYRAFRRAIYKLAQDHVERNGMSIDARVELVAPPPKGPIVRTGYLIQAVDAVRRAGFEHVVFEGAPMPLAGGATDPTTDPEAFRAYARTEGNGHVRVRVNNLRSVLHSASADGPALPPGSFEGRIPEPPMRAGAGVQEGLPGEPREESLEETEEVVEEVEEVVSEEPVVGEGEVVGTDNDPPFGEGGVSDAPFEGPSNNGEIGLGGGSGGAFPGRGGEEAQPEHEARDAAILGALRWLKAHQAPDGAWEAAGFPAWCDLAPAARDGRPDGVGKAAYDPGVTGLALCAFLGAGYTNRGDHPFRKTVNLGLRYLRSIQDPEGCFGTRSVSSYTYNHAMASLAMVEAYGMTSSPIFKGSAQRCLDFIGEARNPYFAWRYGVKPGENDTSVSGWMMMALNSAGLINANARSRGKNAPLSYDDQASEGMLSWLEKVTDPDTGRVGYETRGSGPFRPDHLAERFPPEQSESLTAVGVLTRLLLGEASRRDEIVRKGAALVRALPPRWDTEAGTLDMYYWHFGALAAHQVGGETWTSWQEALAEAIVANQRQDGDYCGFKGSWDPAGPWGAEGGRVYSTAVLALTLETPYRYDRVAPEGR